MIDPQVSLALALRSTPGAYAALIGSGVSVGAGIPTGWQVVLDLISKLAGVLGEDPGADLAAWYQKRFGEEPDYSKLLDALTKSPGTPRLIARRVVQVDHKRIASPCEVHDLEIGLFGRQQMPGAALPHFCLDIPPDKMICVQRYL